MAKYRVLQKSFINNRIVEEGEIVEYEGEVGANLEKVKAPKNGKAEVQAGPEAPAEETELV